MDKVQPAQESEVVVTGVTLGITAWTIAFGALLCVVAYLVLTGRHRDLSRAPTAEHPAAPAREVSNVRLQVFAGPGAGQLLQARQRKQLQHYGWVDRQRGIVSIPIDVAMDLAIKEQKR